MLFSTYMPFWNLLQSWTQKAELMQAGVYFLQLHRKNKYGDPNILFHALNKYFLSMKNLCSVFWQFHDPVEKEVVLHTVRAWKTGRKFYLDGTKAFAKR